MGCRLRCNKWRTPRSHGGRHPCSDVCGLSEGLALTGRPVELSGPALVPRCQLVPQQKCRCQPPLCSLRAACVPEPRAPTNPSTQGRSPRVAAGGSCGQLCGAGGSRSGRPPRCAGKRGAELLSQPAALPARGTRCPADLGGKRLCKRNCKEYKPSEPSKNTFHFFSLFELNGKKQILSPSQMGHGVLAHY